MNITHPSQITGKVALELRSRAGKTQMEFWGPFGVAKAMASGYEREKHRINEPLQILIYMHHICRFPVNAEHDEMLAAGAAINCVAEGMAALKKAAVIAEAAIDHLKSAQACVEEI
jgi:hypothetical protein